MTRDVMLQIGERSRDIRRARMHVRDQLRAGTLTLDQLLTNPPEAIHDLPVMDVLRMLHKTRSSRTLEVINREAVRAQVNLMITVGRASSYTLAWAAANGSRRFFGGPAPAPSREYVEAA